MMELIDEKKIGDSVDEEIELVKKRVLEGPNVHALFPVIEAYVDLGDWVETPSDEDFSRNLVDLLPGLKEHTCSKGYKGGFIERLEEGTYPAHIVEHVALAIQNELGSEVSFGKSRREERSVYKVVTSYEYPSLGSSALEGSIKIVNKLLRGEKNLQSFVKDLLEEAEEVYLEEKIGPSTKAILDAAEKRDIPYKRTGEEYSLFSLGWGKNQKMIWGPETSQTSLIGTEIVQEKDISKDFLYERGLPVPRGEVVNSQKEALEVADNIGYPVVIKPVSGNHGEGVFVNLKNPDELSEVYSLTKEHEPYQLVEKYLEGDDYRVLLVNHEVVAVSKKKTAHVVGDGSSTIKELVELTNQDPQRGNEHENVLTKIKLNKEVLMKLDRQGLSLDHVLDEGEVIDLSETTNISTGGTAEDRTEDIHPSLKRILEKTSKMVNLDLMGIDLIAGDISKPVENIDWGIIEMNASPGLRMHLHPSSGKTRPVGEKIIDHLYPSGKGRIPLIAVTGTNGKTTTSRLIEWLGREQGHHTGLAVTGGIWSDGFKIAEGDTTGPWSANLVLHDPEVDYAVLETARGGMLKRGLGFDRSMVSVVLNIREDHLGLDGVEDRDDIFWVKSLLVEVTDEKGYSVINGNDDYAEQLIEKSRGTPILFGVEKNPLIEEFIENGGEAFVREDDELLAYLKDGKKKIAGVKQLPFLRGGVKMLVENTLAAVAAGYGSGLDMDRFRTALAKFNTDESTNPGRLNVFQINDRDIVIDYAHNPDGLKNLSDFADHVSGDSRTILVFTGLGDRADEDIKKNGKVAGERFDKLVFTEKDDLTRGREPRQILSLLRRGAESEDNYPIVIDDPMEALIFAAGESKAGDTLVCANLDITSEHLNEIFDGQEDMWEGSDGESGEIEDSKTTFLSTHTGDGKERLSGKLNEDV